MKKQTTEIVAYLTWIGLVIALLFGDRRGARQHLNQAVCLAVIGVIWSAVYALFGRTSSLFFFGMTGRAVVLVSPLVQLFLLVFTLWGLIRAIQGNDAPMPLIGRFRLL